MTGAKGAPVSVLLTTTQTDSLTGCDWVEKPPASPRQNLAEQRAKIAASARMTPPIDGGEP